jgi:hypothetical protein
MDADSGPDFEPYVGHQRIKSEAGGIIMISSGRLMHFSLNSFPSMRVKYPFRISVALLVLALGRPAHADTNSLVTVATYHNDNSRQGVNTNETILTLSNVNSNTFGRIFSYSVDGYVYSQPLVVPNVTIPGKGTHNVVYVATENDSVYAFDADNNLGTNATPLWFTNLVGTGETTVPGGDLNTSDIVPEVGITSTPVIDTNTQTIYIEAKTKAVIGSNNHYIHRLHALDIGSGNEKFGGPTTIADTIANNGNYTYVSGPSTPGNGDGSVGGTVNFNGLRQMNRMAVGLINGVVYLGFASHGDNGPYHGWLLGYNATNIASRVFVFDSTPNGGLGGFWSAGGGFTADPLGNIYLMTGNGSFTGTAGTISSTNDFGMSVLKFSTTNTPAAAPKLIDFFAPWDEGTQSGYDLDLGSGDAVILGDSAGSAAHRRLIAVAGKNGAIYLLDRDSLGTYNGNNDNQIVQPFYGAIGGNFGTPVYWNNTLYYIGNGDTLKAFSITNAVINTTPVQSQNPFSGDKSSTTPSLSANGSSNAIIWAVNSAAYASSGPGVLHAFNATNVAQEIYNSAEFPSRDNAGGAVKFTVPTIANGKVYVGTEYQLSVFGLANFLPAPVVRPNGGIFTNSVSVTITDSVPAAVIYYTLDGTTPTTSSTPYTGPFTLTDSASVRTIATSTNTVNSVVVQASFINSSAVGTGVGLLGSYYANHTPDAPFTGPPSLVRTDSIVDFNWNNGPGGGIGQDTFTVEWLGSVQPQFNETYTFTVTGDDGVRLFVNGQELINGWVDQAPTPYTGSITLRAQQLYNIELDYYQNGGGALAQLQWSSPSTTIADIPSSQLYPYTNPPPSVVLSSPASNATYTASASVTVTADADAPYNAISNVVFYANRTYLGSVSNAPYTVTATGLAAGSYALTAVAFDGSGLSATSAPVTITVNAGTGAPYGLTNRAASPAFFNMPTTYAGSLPPLLSQTGVFTNTTAMNTAAGLILYQPNVPLWSDAALKIRYLSVPSNGGQITPDQQIAAAPTGTWTFPAGTVFVKTFELQTNELDTNSIIRLETRLIVRDINGQVYGVTYKWLPDNSDADLLTTSLSQQIPITTATGTNIQTWYYPSPADCLTCHTPVAGYVLGLNTRQLNGNLNYPSTGVTDNQLRTLNRLGLLNPAFDEAAISSFEKLSALTNLTASLQERSRSYLDANCAECHQPNGTGSTFDARYETPLANQNITNYPAKFSLGYDRACIVKGQDIWRSTIYDRMNVADVTNGAAAIQMPPLARNLIDTNAVAVIAAWINTLPGTPALAPASITPPGGTFAGSVNVSLQSTNSTGTLYYTLDGTFPTTNSLVYSQPFTLTNSTLVTVSAYANGFDNSVATGAIFLINPGILLTSPGFDTNHFFQIQVTGAATNSYVLQASTNLVDWTSLSTNPASTNVFNLRDPGATNFPYRFYRVLQQ